jgi:hypothetical protein
LGYEAVEDLVMRSVVGVEEKGIREGGKGGKYLQASKMQMSKSRHWRFGWDMLGLGLALRALPSFPVGPLMR